MLAFASIMIFATGGTAALVTMLRAFRSFGPDVARLRASHARQPELAVSWRIVGAEPEFRAPRLAVLPGRTSPGCQPSRLAA